ncbi:hypothetical protein V6N11_019370 [Hibiscus sabdariffa]|uniref:F-box domain-containing protein n=1 Tax=Hibiscus sabdariffa TaxID=183260 RepID=A0ABR2R301_9ROSI
MSDYMPVGVIVEILKRLPVKSLLRFRSVCKSWNSVICDPCFISTHLQASLSNNTPFLLLSYWENCKKDYFLHYDNDGFDEFKQLQFPVFVSDSFSFVLGSYNGLICLRFWNGVVSKFILWNPSIQKYISLPRLRISNDVHINFGFGFDSRANDYKLVIIGLEKDGAVHWIGYQKRNNVVFTTAILGFYLSAEEFFEISLSESLFGLGPMVLSTIKYGESSIAVLKRNRANELWDLAELWVMKEYGVGEVLVQLDYGKLASLDLNFQQIELHGVELTTKLISLEGSYVESLVLLDKTVDVHRVNL